VNTFKIDVIRNSDGSPIEPGYCKRPWLVLRVSNGAHIAQCSTHEAAWKALERAVTKEAAKAAAKAAAKGGV
jgi:hypothetical protein